MLSYRYRISVISITAAPHNLRHSDRRDYSQGGELNAVSIPRTSQCELSYASANSGSSEAISSSTPGASLIRLQGQFISLGTPQNATNA